MTLFRQRFSVGGHRPGFLVFDRAVRLTSKRSRERCFHFAFVMASSVHLRRLATDHMRALAARREAIRVVIADHIASLHQSC
jgi:hypothetical protein